MPNKNVATRPSTENNAPRARQPKTKTVRFSHIQQQQQQQEEDDSYYLASLALNKQRESLTCVLQYNSMPSTPSNNNNNNMLGAYPPFGRFNDNNDTDNDDTTTDNGNNTDTIADEDMYTTTTTSIHGDNNDDEDNQTTAGVLHILEGGSVVGEEGPLDYHDIDNDDASDKSDDNPRRRLCLMRWLVCLGLLGCAMLVCVLVAWIMLNGDDKGNDNRKVSGTQDVNTNNHPTWVPTVSPSVAPVVASLTPTGSSRDAATPQPTMAPSTPLAFSAAPTHENMLAVAGQVQSLLNMTVSLQDKTSAQYKAVEWLAMQDQVLSAALREKKNDTDFRYSRRLAQRYGLAVLYYTTGGETTWKDQCSFLNATLHECEWKCRDDSTHVSTLSAQDQLRLNNKGITEPGVTCFDFDGFRDEVAHLVLFDNGLAGTLPDEEIGETLIALRTFWLSHNDLVGTIPASLAAGYLMEDVRLEHNRLHGPALPWLQLTPSSALLDWRVSHNNLTGTLTTTDWTGPKHLQVLDLSWNSVKGSLWAPGLWELPALHTIVLSGNELTGNLPDSFGLSAEMVHLDHNFLSGNLPAGLTVAQGLIVLDLRANNLKGPVPESWYTGLDDLEILDVSENIQLEGSLEFFCAAPRAGQTIIASCDILACSCCECV